MPPEEVQRTRTGRRIKKPKIFDPSSPVLPLVLLCIIAMLPSVHNESLELLTCGLRGIRVEAKPGTLTLDVCCNDLCSNRPYKSPFLFPMPDDVLITGLDCLVTYWTGKDNSSQEAIKCGPVDPCSLIQCYVCLDRIFNAQCNPTLSAVVFGVLAFILTSILGTICFLLNSCRLCCRFTRWLCCWPLRKLRRSRIPGRKRYVYQEEWDETPDVSRRSDQFALLPMTDEERFGRPLHHLTPRTPQTPRGTSFELIPLDNRLYGPPRFQSTPKTKFRPLTKLGLALSIICLLFPRSSTATPSSLTATTEECFSNENGTVCQYNSVTELKLLPAGQVVNLLLKSPDGSLAGTLSFRMENLALECVSEHETYTRSYKVDTLASKRCGEMGSCTQNKCKFIASNETVPELAEVNHYLGNTYCEDSWGFWQNLCGRASACLFYRNYLIPTAEQSSFVQPVYQLFRCPTWEYKIKTEMVLNLPGMDPIKEEVDLYNGRTFHWGESNLTLTPAVLGQPPVPVLSGFFIGNWYHGALVPDFPPVDLRCPSEFAASVMKHGHGCSWAVDACTRCRNDHDNGAVRCQCRELNIQKWIDDPTHRLPLNVGKLRLNYHEWKVWAETGYVPVSLTLQIQKLRVTLNHDVAKCEIQPITLNGCYRSQIWVQVSS